MTEQEKKKKRLYEILDNLKDEIFVELDQRIKETEETLSAQISEQVGEQVEGHVEGEVRRQIRHRALGKVNKKLRGDFQNFQENLQLYHKIPYAVMVVTGFMFFWYGAWKLIPMIPILNQGPVALVAGMLLLFITGTIYKKLIG